MADEKAPPLEAWEKLAIADEAAQQAAAGHAVPGAPAVDDGGLLGQGAAAAFGAGSAATFGLTDLALSEGSYLLGGKRFHKDVLSNVKQVREANPYSTMAGEAAGLLMNPSLTAAGEAVEAKVAGQVGEGLLGSMASMGARGAAEASILGAQKQITEDALGDHEYNGEAVFASALKDSLLGAGAGAVLGAGGYGFKQAAGLLKSTRGPMSDAVLDEIAGVEGAGRKLAADAKQAETVVEDLRKTGMTSEQAAKFVDEVGHTAKQAAADGPGSTLMDDVVERYVGTVAGSSPERAEIIRQAYKNNARRLMDAETTVEQHALKMSEKGTKVLRNLEDVVNEVQFTEKSSQFGKLVDPAKLSLQRDQAISLLQESDDMLRSWEAMESRGIKGRDLGQLRKAHNDTLTLLNKIDPNSATAGRDLMIRMDRMKRAFDSTLQWGRENRFGLPEAITSQQGGVEAFTNKLRGALEDEAVWGKAGPAQARWNNSFSTAKARRDDFMGRMGVSIDQQQGIRIPEIDFEKSLGGLRKLRGNAELDGALQEVKSTDAFISGMRDRVAAIREFGDLAPEQVAKLDQGLKDLAEFESAVGAARKDAAIANRLKEAALEERDKGGLGGLIGLAGDIVSKPLTTVERLGRIRQTVKSVEEGVATGLRKFFGNDANAVKVAEKLAPRAKADVAKEIGDIASLRGNPLAMQERASRMVGDLESYAPKTANEVKLTAVRALDYLAREAPRPNVPIGIVALDPKKARYSDQQISEWETKRRAALDPESVVRDMSKGKLNREAIKAVEFVSPKLYAKMQELAQEQITRLAEQGKLDKMPYQQKAVISTLLKVPADKTWTPDFIEMMQAAKAMPTPAKPAGGPPQPNQGVSKRAVEVNTAMFATEADTIEQGRAS